MHKNTKINWKKDENLHKRSYVNNNIRIMNNFQKSNKMLIPCDWITKLIVKVLRFMQDFIHKFITGVGLIGN